MSDIRYPPITDPGNTEEELRQTVRQLTQAVRMLTGNSPAAAVNVNALGIALGGQPVTNTPSGGGPPRGFSDSWVNDAMRRFNAIFTNELASIETEATTEIGEALLALAEGFEGTNENIVFTVGGIERTVDNVVASINDVDFIHADSTRSVAYRLQNLTSVVGTSEAAISDAMFSTADPNTTVVGRLGRLRAATHDNIAAIVTKLGATVTPTGAIAGTLVDVSTTLQGHTASIEEMMMSVDGTLLTWGINATLDGRPGGGVRFTSVRLPDGTPYANFVVDGDFIVNGTITAPKIGAGEITASKISVGVGLTNYVRNPEFQDGTLGAANTVPSWFLGGSNHALNVFHLTNTPGNTYTGNQALRCDIVANGDLYVDSDFFAVEPSTNYDVSAFGMVSVGTNLRAQFLVHWYDTNQNYITGAVIGSNDTGVFTRIIDRVTSNVSARWAKVQCRATDISGVTPGIVWFDTVRVSRVLTKTGIDVDGVDLLNIIEGSAGSVTAASGSQTNYNFTNAVTSSTSGMPSTSYTPPSGSSGKVLIDLEIEFQLPAGTGTSADFLKTYDLYLNIIVDGTTQRSVFCPPHKSTDTTDVSKRYLWMIGVYHARVYLTLSTNTAHTISSSISISNVYSGGPGSVYNQGNLPTIIGRNQLLTIHEVRR